MRSKFNKARLTDAACRTHFPSFIRMRFHILNPSAEYLPNWHYRALAFHLEDVRRGNTKRLAIALPPRYGKSFMASIAFPAFVLGHDPTKRIIVTSYNADLAATLSYDFRAIVEDVRYQRLFPAMRIARNTEFEVVTDQRGYRFATSVDGTLTGRGADILIVDEYLKSGDALSDTKRTAANNWFFNTALSRLDNKQKGAIIIIGHRLHDDDLIGTVTRSFDDLRLLSLPAIAEEDAIIQISDKLTHHRSPGEVLHPQLEPIGVLEKSRAQMGSETFSAQYQQCPISAGGVMIKRQWLRYYDEPPKRTASICFQSWDTATKPGESNDWSVCTTWVFHENKYYLIDLLRGRFDYPTLREHAIAHARMHKPTTILVEDVGLGSGLVSDLKKQGFSINAVTPQANKQTRMSIQSARIERGEMLFPKHAHWLAEVEREICDFPNGRYDDIVDSTSQALAYEPNGFDIVKYANGMERLRSTLMFEQMFRGRIF